jgi:hypothetical protein
MLFGHSDSFFIRTNLIEIRARAAVGYLSFGVAVCEFGDFDEVCNLTISAHEARVFLRASQRRTRIDLDNLSSEDVFHLLYDRYVISVHRGIFDVKDPARQAPPTEVWDRDPYLLEDIGQEALRDKYALIAVRRGDGTDRVICKSYRDNSLQEAIVPVGTLDAVLVS